MNACQFRYLKKNKNRLPVTFWWYQFFKLLQAFLRSILLNECNCDDDNYRYRNTGSVIKLLHARTHHC